MLDLLVRQFHFPRHQIRRDFLVMNYETVPYSLHSNSLVDHPVLPVNQRIAVLHHIIELSEKWVKTGLIHDFSPSFKEIRANTKNQ